MSALAALPIIFGVVYITLCISVVVVAVRTGSTEFPHPLVCAAGASPPAYSIYSAGSVLSALLLLASAWSHALFVGDLASDEYVRVFLLACAGIASLASIFMALMGTIPFRGSRKRIHNIITVAFITSGCTYEGFLVSAAFLVEREDVTPFPLATIVLRIAAAVVFCVSGTVSGLHLQKAESLAKERRELAADQQQGAAPEESSPVAAARVERTPDEQRAWNVAAFGQYIQLLGIALTAASLALEMV